jgi:hypothetical protein
LSDVVKSRIAARDFCRDVVALITEHVMGARCRASAIDCGVLPLLMPRPSPKARAI